jgi:hypothetical protein
VLDERLADRGSVKQLRLALLGRLHQFVEHPLRGFLVSGERDALLAWPGMPQPYHFALFSFFLLAPFVPFETRWPLRT